MQSSRNCRSDTPREIVRQLAIIGGRIELYLGSARGKMEISVPVERKGWG